MRQWGLGEIGRRFRRARESSGIHRETSTLNAICGPDSCWRSPSLPTCWLSRTLRTCSCVSKRGLRNPWTACLDTCALRPSTARGLNPGFIVAARLVRKTLRERTIISPCRTGCGSMSRRQRQSRCTPGSAKAGLTTVTSWIWSMKERSRLGALALILGNFSFRRRKLHV
jgi:hypothetical protein